ncbi:MAG: GspH/FimT family pseudopilin [Proteobacteria bacterium]|nr:GspH/FimT family pseudopilin [Pseudomonadota bacterium]
MHRYRGFTLIELLIVMFVMALLASVSLPDFSAMLENKRSDTTIKRLAQGIEFARVSAITTGSLVTLCRSSDGTECGGNWQEGILIFTDSNGDRVINHQDRILRHLTFAGLPGTLRWRAFQNRQYLQITSQGFTRYQNGNFTYCPSPNQLQFARQLIINRSARVRFAMDSDGDGFREDSRGRRIDCS